MLCMLCILCLKSCFIHASSLYHIFGYISYHSEHLVNNIYSYAFHASHSMNIHFVVFIFILPSSYTHCGICIPFYASHSLWCRLFYIHSLPPIMRSWFLAFGLIQLFIPFHSSNSLYFMLYISECVSNYMHLIKCISFYTSQFIHPIHFI